MKSNEIIPLIVFAPGMMAGAEKVVIGSIEGLIEIGILPKIIIIKETRKPQFAEEFLKYIPAQVEVIVLETYSAIDLRLINSLRRIFNHLNANHVIHTHGFKALIYSNIANLKLIHTHTHHGDTSFDLKVRIYESIARFFMKRCSIVFSVSDEMTKQLKEKLKPFQNIITIYNMLSFSDSSTYRKSKKMETSDHIKVLFVGRLSEEKGIIEFINFFKELNTKQYFLTIVGDGHLKNQVEALVLNSANINFVGYQKNPQSFFIENDILVMPSFREGLPITLIESLSLGVPVISHEVGALPFLITNNFNGQLIKLNNHQFDEAEWKKIFDLLPTRIKQMKIDTFKEAEKIENLFSKKRWAENTYKSYLSLFR